MNKAIKVKNKEQAPVQTTVEQIIKDSFQKKTFKKTQKEYTNKNVIEDVIIEERNKFEFMIKRYRNDHKLYVKYALFEEKIGELDKARSVFERGIDSDYKNTGIWIRYIEMELKNNNINHARNLFERVVYLCPTNHVFWRQYINMENRLKNTENVRKTYEKWIETGELEEAFHNFVKFEIKNKNYENIRYIYIKLINKFNTVKNYINFIKFEESLGNIDYARHLFKQQYNDPVYYVEYSKFEERQGDLTLASEILQKGEAIYQYSIEIKEEIINFKSKHGALECSYKLFKDKMKYELINGEVNFIEILDFIMDEESNEERRDLFEFFIEKCEKRLNKENINHFVNFLLFFACFQEKEFKDLNSAEKLYKKAITLFSKDHSSNPWVYYSKFLFRNRRLDDARKNYGRAIGTSPSQEIFDNYIKMEEKLGNYDRCRIIFKKYIEYKPYVIETWIKFAEFEKSLNEFERLRSIYESCIGRNITDTFIFHFKLIEFEKEMKEYKNIINIYENIVLNSNEYWRSYLEFALEYIKDNNFIEVLLKRANDHMEENEREEVLSMIQNSGYETKQHKDKNEMLLDIARRWKSENE